MDHAESNSLPPDFLAKKAQGIIVRSIDLSTIDPDLKGLYAVTLDNVLSASECRLLLQAAEASTTDGWQRAMVNYDGPVLKEDIRRSDIIYWSSQTVVDRIWDRIKDIYVVKGLKRLVACDHITGAGSVKRGEIWKFSRPNPKMRVLRYTGGEYYHKHCDEPYLMPDGKERAYFTMQIYLSDAVALTDVGKVAVTSDTLLGGATAFHPHPRNTHLEAQHDVQPKSGRVLLFQHRDLLHSAERVLQGVKYAIRTDLLYVLESWVTEEKAGDEDVPKVLLDA